MALRVHGKDDLCMSWSEANIRLLILCGCEFNKQLDPVVIGLLTSANSEKKDEGHAQAGNHSLSIYQTL